MAKNQKLTSSEENKQEVDIEIPADVLAKITADAEKKAYERVCKAVGTTPGEVADLEQRTPVKEDMISYDITPVVVKINGEAQPSRGVAPRSKVEVIMAAAGNMRNRRLEELVGRSFDLVTLRDGTMQARLVSAEDAAGLKVNV